MLIYHYERNFFSVAGLPSSKLVEAHGTFQTSSCTKCDQPQPMDYVKVNTVTTIFIKYLLSFNC